MTSVAAEVKRLEDEVAAARKELAVLAEVRRVLGPVQLTIPVDAATMAHLDDWKAKCLEATGEAEAMQTIASRLRMGIVEALDFRGSYTDEQLIGCIAAAVKKRDEQAAELKDLGLAIVQAYFAIPEERREMSADQNGLVAAVDELRGAIGGLAEDLACAVAVQPTPSITAKDLALLDAMIDDEKGMTWDLPAANRQALKRVRAALAPEQPRETAATPAKSAAPTSAVESNDNPAAKAGIVETDDEGGDTPMPPSSEVTGPWVIMRTIPQGRQLYHEVLQRWIPVADIVSGKAGELTGTAPLEFSDRADAEGVKRGMKLKRSRVCTLDEARGTTPSATPAPGPDKMTRRRFLEETEEHLTTKELAELRALRAADANGEAAHG